MVIVDGRVQGCGVMILNGDRVLIGKRSDGQGWSLAGGKVEEGETLHEAAARELYEEFKVKAIKLSFLCKLYSVAIVRGEMREVESNIFVCRNYSLPKMMEPNREMLEYAWVTIRDVLDSVSEIGGLFHLFEPTRLALQFYVHENDLTAKLPKDSITKETK